MDDNIIRQSIIEKMDAFEKTILSIKNALIELNNRQKGAEDKQNAEIILSQKLNTMENHAKHLLGEVNKVSEQSKMLADKLDTHTHLMENPPVRKYKILHRLSWSWIIAIGGMLIVGLLTGLLIVTHSKLGNYVANDTKYRYLKIQSTGKFRQYLYNLDSLYLSDPSLKTNVIKAEQERKEKLQLSQKIQNQQQNLKQLQREKSQKKDYLKPLN